MEKSLKNLLDQHDNDYSHLEVHYRRETGSELVIDPYRSVSQPLADLTLTASVIIPAYNASHTILQCLYAIEQSSFNRKYPRQLEVIVVDDGSTDTTWELLNQLSFGLSLKVVHQANYGRSQARNTALAVATGDVIICCDADLIMTPFAIEEFMKRHQVLDHVLLLGFYTYLHETDSHADPAFLPRTYGRKAAPFMEDRRVKRRADVWPESIFRDTQHLKRLGKGRVLYTPYETHVGIPQTVYGPLFSLRRRDFLLMGGFEENIQGWGCEILLVAARAGALGNYVIPTYAAAGFHVYRTAEDAHFLWRYNPGQRLTWQEYAANFQLYLHLLHSPFTPAPAQWIEQARLRIQCLYEYHPVEHRVLPQNDSFYETYDQVLARPEYYARYLECLGRYQEALEILARIQEQESTDTVCRQASALLHLGRSQEAVARLQKASETHTSDGELQLRLAFALAATSQFVSAQQHVHEAQKTSPESGGLRYLTGRSFAQHRERARLSMRQGDYELALRDYEAALIDNPEHFAAQVERAQALCASGRHEAATTARDRYYLSTHPIIIPFPERSQAFVDAWNALLIHQPGAAKVYMERLRRLCGLEISIIEHLQEIHEYAESCARHYSHRTMLSMARDIPGCFTENELELLLTLTMQILVARRDHQPVTIVELGSFAGQATVVLGLAMQSAKARARIIAVYEAPTEVIDNEYMTSVLPQELLEWQLHKCGIAEYVIHTTTSPEMHDCELLLVGELRKEGNVRQKVAGHLDRLCPGGLLLVHLHTNDHPVIQDMIHELLMSGSYQFLAQVDHLVVLQQKSVGNFPKPGEHNSCPHYVKEESN